MPAKRDPQYNSEEIAIDDDIAGDDDANGLEDFNSLLPYAAGYAVVSGGGLSMDGVAPNDFQDGGVASDEDGDR